MKLYLKEDHHLALERAGYQRYGQGRYSYIKYIKLESSLNRDYFHAIVSYNNASISLHRDIHQGSNTKHITHQLDRLVVNEANRIKQFSLYYKLNMCANKWIQKLVSSLKLTTN